MSDDDAAIRPALWRLLCYGLRAASLASFLGVWFWYLALARRGLGPSLDYPIELNNHGRLFFASRVEAFGMGGLLAAAAVALGAAALVDYRLVRSRASQ